MAVTRRIYIFGAFLSSVLSVVLLIIAIASTSWIVSTATAPVQAQDSIVRYGLFKGEVILHNLATPSQNTLYMTCVPGINACAVSCKTEAEARELEVTALANRFRPNQACVSYTTVDESDPLEHPAVISFAVYATVLTLLFLQLVLSVVAAGLAIFNATKNPTEPLFGLPGCLYTNIATSLIGFTILLLFGIYWATSGWQDHLAFSYIALGLFAPGPSLGFSYWLLLPAWLCSTVNIGLIMLRNYLLERDPPPPTIKIDNHADGNIFLY